MSVYINHDVSEVVQLYTGLCYPIPKLLTVRAFLQQAAERLYEAHFEGKSAAVVPIKNWHPELVGLSNQIILSAPFAVTDALLTVAREYGFDDWTAVEQLQDQLFDSQFEAAVDAVVTGDLVWLQGLLAQQPSLIQQRSPFGHRASLLHYVGSNGVETWRQQVPLNIVQVAKTLLAAGADPFAMMTVYGGQYTTRALVETSAHPADAGVSASLSRLLQEAENEFTS